MYKEIVEAPKGTKVICVSNSHDYCTYPIIGEVTTLIGNAEEADTWIFVGMEGKHFKKRDFRLCKEPLDIQSIYDEE